MTLSAALQRFAYVNGELLVFQILQNLPFAEASLSNAQLKEMPKTFLFF